MSLNTIKVVRNVFEYILQGSMVKIRHTFIFLTFSYNNMDRCSQIRLLRELRLFLCVYLLPINGQEPKKPWWE